MTDYRSVCLLLLAIWVVSIGPVTSRQTNDGEGERRTFKYTDPVTGNRRRCMRCPPGTYMQEPCFLSKEDTTCFPCPEGHFTSEWNHHASCFPCKGCSEDPNAYLSIPCSADMDAVCACKEGYFLHDHQCLPHKTCPPGRGVVMQGTSNYNTVCERCPDGKFSDVDSNVQPCSDLTDCASLGLDTLEAGSRYQDSICSEPAVTTVKMATTKKSTVKPTTAQKLATTLATKRPTLKSMAVNQAEKPHHYTGPFVHHPPDFEEDFLKDEREAYFDEEMEMEMEEMEFEMEENGVKEYEKLPAHGVHETHFNVEEQSEHNTHISDNGSGLAAGILAAGCLFLLVLIAILYHRKKRVEEQQKMRKLQEQPPKWQKLEKPHASEENMALFQNNQSRNETEEAAANY